MLGSVDNLILVVFVCDLGYVSAAYAAVDLAAFENPVIDRLAANRTTLRRLSINRSYDRSRNRNRNLTSGRMLYPEIKDSGEAENGYRAADKIDRGDHGGLR